MFAPLFLPKRYLVLSALTQTWFARWALSSLTLARTGLSLSRQALARVGTSCATSFALIGGAPWDVAMPGRSKLSPDPTPHPQNWSRHPAARRFSWSKTKNLSARSPVKFCNPLVTASCRPEKHSKPRSPSAGIARTCGCSSPMLSCPARMGATSRANCVPSAPT
jgi:hypothetical protein